MTTPKVNVYYRHRYGGLYMVQDIAISTVDKSKWVVYVHCYPFEYQTWIRPHDEWCEDGRFTRLTEAEYRDLTTQDRIELQGEITAARKAAKG